MGLTETDLQPALQLARTPQRPADGQAYVGLGWGVPKSGVGVQEHKGGSFGPSSWLAWDTQRKIGMVLLINTRIDTDDYYLQLMRGYLPKPFPVDPEALPAYAGRYQLPDGGIATISVDGSNLLLKAPDGDWELMARSDNQFYVRAFVAEITFYRNDRGEVDRAVVVLLGATLEAKKIP